MKIFLHHNTSGDNVILTSGSTLGNFTSRAVLLSVTYTPPEPSCSLGCLFIRNSTKDNLTIFDYSGNIWLKGNFSIQSLATPLTPDGSDFQVRNSSDVVAWVNDVNGA